MAAAYDAQAGTSDFSVTSITTASFTISGSNRAASVVLGTHTNISTITTSCGGQSGTLVTGASATNNGTYQRMYGVIAPATGSQTASASWTTSANVWFTVVTATGVNQTTPLNGGTSNPNTGSNRTSAAVTITSATGDLTTSAVVCVDHVWSTSQTLRADGWLQLQDTAAGAASVTHTWSGTTNQCAVVGANFVAAGAAAASRQGLLMMGCGR